MHIGALFGGLCGASSFRGLRARRHRTEEDTGTTGLAALRGALISAGLYGVDRIDTSRKRVDKTRTARHEPHRGRLRAWLLPTRTVIARGCETGRRRRRGVRRPGGGFLAMGDTRHAHRDADDHDHRHAENKLRSLSRRRQIRVERWEPSIAGRRRDRKQQRLRVPGTDQVSVFQK